MSALPHCAAMCAPLAGFACVGQTAGSLATLLGTRLLVYGILGAGFGMLGAWAVKWIPPQWSSLFLGLAVASGMLIAAWQLEWPWLKQLAPLRKRVGLSSPPLIDPSSLVTRVAPTRKSTGSLLRPLGIGLSFAFFPCGTLHAALMLAGGQGSAWKGFFTMAGFALSSSLALWASGWLGSWLYHLNQRARHLFAAILVLGALVVLLRPLKNPMPAAGQACHGVSWSTMGSPQ
ncbi:MAG: sulfite exporter TauE/SafE family protein [Sandaracinaceae bacterium]|nr:sulfite exporter TauE/SafE family protein [Sandaracinaceae bacterium]MDW8246128.1 sulfite exporter TauE/SafE family protein [Sandaracinaceae bacterium]